ncbi:Protein lethal(2)denticleless [Portunus trituberculatus]|uniref:Protein lethal(2)denticleless n=1 Tax=Portunus trituberculatus TaxID=210409 RepID=A0A5B7E1I5_PORTR|nr:Protein lethal(2)denticleless [Portunus trituberculatus]
MLLTVEEDGCLTTAHTFLGHTRSIKTVSVNRKDPCMIATGARDGNIIIWDRRCRPHHRADEIAPAHHSLSMFT